MKRLDARPLIAFLVAVTGGLLAINVITKVVSHPIDGRGVWLVQFDVNREANIPTFWNGSLLLGIACLCLAMAFMVPRRRLGWTAAFLAAGLMAADEIVRWHERLERVGSAVSSALGFSIPTYAWLLPGVVLAAGFVVLVGLWVRQLPRDVARGVTVGAAMYLLGALGAEAASGWIDGVYGIGHAFNAITTIEEGLEMAGCIVVIAALLRPVRVIDDGVTGRSVTVAVD